MARFDPATWSIEIYEHSTAELESDPVIQARFVHEYVHYLQTLTGTLGRQILGELVRLSIFAGLWKRYGRLPDKLTEQIDLLATLEGTPKSALENTEPAKLFAKLTSEMAFVFACHIVTPTSAPQGDVVRQVFSHVGETVPDFPHI